MASALQGLSGQVPLAPISIPLVRRCNPAPRSQWCSQWCSQWRSLPYCTRRARGAMIAVREPAEPAEQPSSPAAPPCLSSLSPLRFETPLIAAAAQLAATPIGPAPPPQLGAPHCPCFLAVFSAERPSHNSRCAAAVRRPRDGCALIYSRRAAARLTIASVSSLSPIFIIIIFPFVHFHLQRQ